MMHKECLSDKGRKVLRSLNKVIKKYHAVLAGGTALAAKLGHRISERLDFYTETYFDPASLVSDIRKTGRPITVISGEEGYLFAEVDGVRFTMLEYDYPFIQEAGFFEEISVAGVLDIAAMKLMALTNHGSKEDFVDIYFILKGLPFPEIAAHMVKRFGRDMVSSDVIRDSLVNFSTADNDPDPEYTEECLVRWESVKAFLMEQSIRFAVDVEAALIKRKPV
ncbi:MAG: nucleotidyl transferase AbiEii/AbiGii toxin family protein [Nitrospirae bacterium]|nr:nucleotidyl transferase AbiEii/AbiGii toxin family protein [Nitrospirota bacterium]